MIELADHFRSDDRNRHSEWLHHRQWFIKAKQQQARREDNAEKLDDDITALAVEAVVATEAQIRLFQTQLASYEARLDQYDAKLNAYDEAVTHALIEHLERLQILEARHAELLVDASALEDGRKVFKSKDGTFVIGENGDEVGADIVDPASIPDELTSAEDYRSSLDRIKAEKAIGADLYSAQSQIDVARGKSDFAREKLNEAKDASDQDGISIQELEDFEAELEAVMPSELPSLPASAMKHLSGVHNANAIPNAKTEFAKPANMISTENAEATLTISPALN